MCLQLCWYSRGKTTTGPFVDVRTTDLLPSLIRTYLHWAEAPWFKEKCLFFQDAALRLSVQHGSESTLNLVNGCLSSAPTPHIFILFFKNCFSFLVCVCVCLHIPAYYDTCVEVRGTMKSSVGSGVGGCVGRRREYQASASCITGQ